MRKIEQEMLQAIQKGRNVTAETWKNGNTCVTVFEVDAGIRESRIYLHGNLIATAYHLPFQSFISPDVDTFKRWPTRTTVSRLRALGIDASIRKGIPCIDGKPV